jgi:methylated-DNA-protein-cysteine methyltransferase-like protein
MMNESISDFTRDTLRIIRSIPRGRVLTYGLIARWAGAPRASRQVSRTLHAMTEKYGLPWHRVINSQGTISLPSLEGKEHQKYLLEQEGVRVSARYEVDLKKYLWDIDAEDFEALEDTDI